MLKNTNWSTEEIKAKVESIAAELNALGFEEIPERYPIHGSTRFCRPNDGRKEFYQGTYLNYFSKDDAIQLYQDKVMVEEKSIVIHEVFRHNGKEKNSSIDLTVSYCGCKDAPVPFTMKWKDGKGGVEEETTPHWDLTGSHEDIRRFKPTLSAKLQSKMIAQAVEKYDAIQLKDWSPYELNRADFPKDTTEEHGEWKSAQVAARKAELQAARNK